MHVRELLPPPGMPEAIGTMRIHCIGLITPADPDAQRPEWLDPIFRHWPEGASTPRLEPITPEDLLMLHPGERAKAPWDAVILAAAPGMSETAVCRVLDAIQQAAIPALLLVSDKPERLDEFHPGSVLVQPMTADPRAVAAMLYALAARQTAVRSMDQNLRLAHSFQGETAAEIDRLHQELLLAARVQRDFMPKHMPEVDGMEASVLFRPAGFVSGDTYDVQRLDEHHVGFFLADAMGHGVPAALMTLYISGSLPRKEITADGYRIVPPSESLTRLNNSLQECLAGPARFVTAVCGVIDTRTGVITIACAGHPPPLRVGKHGVKPVEVSGMLLGVVSGYEYEQVTIKLEEDELLVLHSDGVEAAFTPRNSAPSDVPSRPAPPYFSHFAAMRRGDALRDLNTAMQHLAYDIDGQSGSLHQDDDITVLALQTMPQTGKPARQTCEDEPIRL